MNFFRRAQPVTLTPDGRRYVLAAEGHKVSQPFHYRWLLPKLCGVFPEKWIRAQDISTILLPLLGFWFAGGGWRGVFVGLSVLGLNGVIRFNRRFPVLVDLPAMTVALASAACWVHGLWYLALPLAIVAACIKETSPIFAAAYAWNPWLLVGLIAPAARHFVRRQERAVDEENEWHLREVVRSAFKYRANWPRGIYLLPWGALIVAGAHISPQLGVTLALAYGQMVVATDAVRLYQWAWPVVAVAAAGAVPTEWLPVLLALHLMNPFAGEGS
jgi:hypothetical protein